MAENWTIKRCLDWTHNYLNDKGIERARFTAEWMLSAATGLSRTELYMSFDRPLDANELASMHDFVVRRAKGEPLQYITGDTQFRTLTIFCEPGVLIPRPETELLVDEVLGFLDAQVLEHTKGRTRVELPWNTTLAAMHDKTESDSKKQFEALDEAETALEPNQSTSDALETKRHPLARVLEIGSGTGCISLSLAAERTGQVQCVATDINPLAVALSLRNRDALGTDATDVDIREGNLVDPIKPDEYGTFDVLVSNPPYIPENVMEHLPAEVKNFEPRDALASGADGLDMFRRIIDVAPNMLRPGGLLACELFEESLDTAANMCSSQNYCNVHVINDLAGRPRILLANIA